MTVGPHGMPGVQQGQPPGPAAPALPAPPAPPPGYDWRNQPPPPARRNKGLMVAVAAAILAIAALVVGVIDLARPAPTAQPSAPAAASTSAAPAPARNTTDDADRALCSAIAPLMADYDRTSNAWTGSGDPGTPERDAALPKYRSDTEDWAGRIQDLLDAHQDADPLFKRTLQRFIDDRVLMVRNMRPGPSKTYDDEAWADSMTAYGGPLSVCWKLGIKWQ